MRTSLFSLLVLVACGDPLPPASWCVTQRVPVARLPNQPVAHPGPTGLVLFDSMTVEVCVDEYPLVLP
jgi:hypothetical protein